MKRYVSLLLLAASAWAGPVKVVVEDKTHPVIFGDYRDDGSPRAMYHKPETLRTNDITFPLITLSNGRVEIKIVPTLGMRVLNAVDLKSGQSFAGTADPRRYARRGVETVDGGKAMKRYVSLLLLAASAWAGPVKVVVEDKTHPVIFGDYRDDGSPRAMYHKPETLRTNDITFPLITLSNGRVEIKIVPTLGMRVLNAIDLKSGQSFAGTADPRRFEAEPFKDTLPFDAGFTEASFPYFEHGIGVRQSAGWRVITNADASVTVAMNMRFTHHQEPRHMGRYGRYSQAQLSQWLTLKPDDDSYTVTYRLDNPTPLRRSNRLWVNHIFYTDKYNEQHILYPAGYVIPHNGQTVAPFYAAGGNLQWVNISHFALYPEYGFSGIYAPDRKVNTVIFQDTKIAPGMKLYTPKGDGGKMEIWHGTTPVFEDPGHFLAPFEPVQFTLTYRMVAGERYWEGVKNFADTRDRLATVKPLGGKFRLELEEITNHVGAPTDRDAIGVARKGKPEDPEYALSLANVCYRYGHFDLAMQLTADAYLRGLIAWERGEKVDFGQAGLDAHYHRALLAIQAGKKDDAVKLLNELIAARPAVYRPRLLKAYLTKDLALAATLAAENPASPEAQLVLELLGQPSAKAALVRDNPEAAEQVEAFRRELTEGHWQYVRRYGPLLPKEAK